MGALGVWPSCGTPGSSMLKSAASVGRLPHAASGQRPPLVQQHRRAALAQRCHLVRVHRREEEVVVRAWRPRLVAHGELVDGEGEKLGTPGRSTTRAMATAAPSSSAAASSAPSVRAPPAASAGCPSVRASANGDAAAVTVRRFPTAPTKAGCLANHDPRRAALLRAGLPVCYVLFVEEESGFLYLFSLLHLNS